MAEADEVVNLDSKREERDREKRDGKRFICNFDSRFLTAFEPIIGSDLMTPDGALDLERMNRSLNLKGLMVEPCPQGGVILAATDGVVLAAVRDPDGAASKPARLNIPDAMFAAAKPGAVAMHYPGDSLEVELPEWAQPGRAVCFEAGAFILPRMRHPRDAAAGVEDSHTLFNCIRDDRGDGFGIGKIVVDWRKMLNGAAGAPAGEWSFSPNAVAKLQGFLDLRIHTGGSEVEYAWLHDGGKRPIQFRIPGWPEFAACVAPCRRVTAGPVSPGAPAWVGEAKPAPESAMPGGEPRGDREQTNNRKGPKT